MLPETKSVRFYSKGDCVLAEADEGPQEHFKEKMVKSAISAA